MADALRAFAVAIVALPLLAGAAAAQQMTHKIITVTQGTDFSAAVSPAGDKIAMDLQGQLWVLPFAGGEAKALTKWQMEVTRPSWSPDGKQIVFQSYSSGNFHIWLINADGSGLRQLTNDPFDDREPAWSPDGAQIAFASDRAQQGSYDIWTADTKRGVLKRRTSATSEESEPVFTGPNSIAFVEGGKKLWEIDGTGKWKSLAEITTGTLLAPASGPNGLAYVVTTTGRGIAPSSKLVAGGKDVTKDEDVFPLRPQFLSATSLLYTADGAIKVRDLATGSVRSIPFRAAIALDRPVFKPKDHHFSDTDAMPVKGLVNPRLSPDGKAVVLAAKNDVYIIRRGQAPQQVTHDGYVEVDMGWSPDGRSIIYTSDKDGHPQIYRRELASGQETKLTAEKAAAFGGAISPDGKRLAYIDADNAVKVMDIGSGTPKKLADAKGRELVGRPTWSPDNRHIAFSDRGQVNTRFREGFNQIRMVNADGEEDRFVSVAPFQSIADRGDSGPVWSPDGKTMAFIMQSVLWVMPATPDGKSAGPSRRVTSETADSPSWSGDSKTLLYIHNGTLKTVSQDGKAGAGFPVALTWSNALPAGDTVIHAGHFWDGLANAERSDVDIVIHQDRITAIRPHAAARPAGARYIEAGDKSVIPGLWDLHTHPEDSYQLYSTRWWRMYMAMGQTSTLSEGGVLNIDISRRESLASGALLGPRIFATGELMDGPRNSHPMTRSIVSDMQMKLELARQAALDTDFIKTYVRLPGTQMKMAADSGAARGIPVGSHYLTPGIEAGESLTTHLSATSRTGYALSQTGNGRSYQDVAALYGQGGFGMIDTTQGAMSLVGDDPAIAKDPRVLKLYLARDIEGMAAAAAHPSTDIEKDAIKRHAALFRDIIKRGGSIAVGTDSPLAPGITATGIHMDLRAMVMGGFTPIEALKMATSVPARMMGVEKDLGSLTPGKIADLDIIDGDPVKNIADTWKVSQVMKAGHLYSQADIAAGF